MKNELSVLTFNIWDMPIWIPNLNRKNRLKRIPDEINKMLPDIICLQESFKVANRKRLVEQLNYNYHFTGNYATKNFFPFIKIDIHGGLFILTKYKILWQKFIMHETSKEMSFDEKISQKGSLIISVESFLGNILIVNTHLCSGRRATDTDLRIQQLDSLFQNLEKLLSNESMLLLTGDFNSSPTTPFPAASKYTINPEYQYILDHGFVDTLNKYDKETITYAVPGNKYAEMWYNVSKEPQRFAYIFTKSHKFDIQSNMTSVVFNDPEPLSDHYALFTKLKIL